MSASVSVISTDVSFNCPFCDGRAHVVGASSAIVHTLPPCEKWLELDCHEYLHEVNEAIVAGGADAVRRAVIVSDEEN
jgi:hypothetical protein